MVGNTVDKPWSQVSTFLPPGTCTCAQGSLPLLASECITKKMSMVYVQRSQRFYEVYFHTTALARPMHFSQ